MTEIGKLRKAVATIDDGEVVFTVEGFIDFSCDWTARVHFHKMPLLDKSWIARKSELLFADEDIKEVLDEEYKAFNEKYLAKTVEIEEVDCEHDDQYVFENEDGVNECDRCRKVLA